MSYYRRLILFLSFIVLATTTVPYSSAPTTPSTKLETIKNWTISTYKCSRQTIYEKLGKTSRTVDTELEAQIESLRETQRKYSNILRLSRALTSHFYHVIQTQVNNIYLQPNTTPIKTFCRDQILSHFTFNGKNVHILVS